MKRKLLKKTFLYLFLLFSLTVFGQFEIPEKPNKQTSVYDYIGLLNASQKTALEEKLIRYSDSTSTQIVIVIIQSTEGESINYLTANWGEAWGIGQEKEDNGILILLAEKDKDISIQAGKGVEHLLTDFMSKNIIDTKIIPQFKKGDYFAGLDVGVNTIFEVLTGEYKATPPKKTSHKITPFFIAFIIIAFIIIIVLISKGGGSSGRRFRRGTASDILETIILSNAGRGSFGKSSSSGGFGSGSFGGGFSGGFGGGSFGGGGASGSW